MMYENHGSIVPAKKWTEYKSERKGIRNKSGFGS